MTPKCPDCYRREQLVVLFRRCWRKRSGKYSKDHRTVLRNIVAEVRFLKDHTGAPK